jgi:GEVED domain
MIVPISLKTYLYIGLWTVALPIIAQMPSELPDLKPLMVCCGTKDATHDEIRYILDVVNQQIVARNAGTTCIAIQPHIVRNDNGSSGISIEQLNKGLANLNFIYKGAGIEFYWKGMPDYANNSDYATYNEQSPDNDTETGLRNLFTTATDAINIYYVQSIKVAGGIETAGYIPPCNNICSILMTYSAQTAYKSSILAHEFGHYFSLLHTHQGTEFGNSNPNAENVARSGTRKNCNTKGDLLCDTPADPKGLAANCAYTGHAVDIHGEVYTPPVGNLMSYYLDACNVNTFTPEQYLQIQKSLAIRLTDLNYSLMAVPQIVANPSALTVVQNGGQIQLNWADNANNDMGYLIERSETSSTSGFSPLLDGGTAISATTFSDMTIANNVTYYYRVKAANDNCNHYSNVVSATVNAAYCTPIYTNVCHQISGIPFYIGSVRLATTDGRDLLVNANNSCNTAVSDYTRLTAEVRAGNNYNMTVTLTNASGNYYPQNVGIWLDLNNDKDFDDSGEFLNYFTAGSGTRTGTIQIPANTTNGTHRMRVRSVYKTETLNNTEACTNKLYGEAEDYTLNVTGGVAVANEEIVEKTLLKVVPNPNQGDFEIHFQSDLTQSVSCSLIDMLGRVIAMPSVEASQGLNVIKMALPMTATTGLYLLRWQQKGRVQMVSLFVLKE